MALPLARPYDAPLGSRLACVTHRITCDETSQTGPSRTHTGEGVHAKGSSRTAQSGADGGPGDGSGSRRIGSPAGNPGRRDESGARDRRRAPQPARREAARATRSRPAEGHQRRGRGRAARHQQGRQGRPGSRARQTPSRSTSTSNSLARRRTRSSSSSPSSATSATDMTQLRRHRHQPEHSGADRLRRPAAQLDSRSRIGRSTTRTIWQPDYNQAHYEQLYFGEGEGVESLKTYYETQSSGRYSVDGMVDRLGQGATTTRLGTAAATASPARATSAATPGT